MPLDPANGYPHTPEHYAAFAGDQKRQAFQCFKDIDAAMRTNYAANIVNIGANIYPVLYVESTFDGGRYTLVTDRKTRYVHQNVGEVYDIMKATAHIPLGIFSIISGYGDYAELGQWKSALEAYRHQIALARNQLENLATIDSTDKRTLDAMFSASLDFIDKIIDAGGFDYASFAEYSHSIRNEIYYCQKHAAANQVKVMTEVLVKWKEMLGDKWDNLYVVIGAIWTLTVENAHELIIKSQMREERRETHVIVSEAVPDLASAQTLLGRIVGDRVMAELVFDKSAGQAFAEDIYSLSTRRDLLSQAVKADLPKSFERAAETAPPACPHLNR